MQDLIYVALMVALVVIAWTFVVGCDRILGPDAQALRAVAREESDSRKAGRKAA